MKRILLSTLIACCGGVFPFTSAFAASSFSFTAGQCQVLVDAQASADNVNISGLSKNKQSIGTLTVSYQFHCPNGVVPPKTITISNKTKNDALISRSGNFLFELDKSPQGGKIRQDNGYVITSPSDLNLPVVNRFRILLNQDASDLHYGSGTPINVMLAYHNVPVMTYENDRPTCVVRLMRSNVNFGEYSLNQLKNGSIPAQTVQFQSYCQTSGLLHLYYTPMLSFQSSSTPIVTNSSRWDLFVLRNVLTAKIRGKPSKVGIQVSMNKGHYWLYDSRSLFASPISNIEINTGKQYYLWNPIETIKHQITDGFNAPPAPYALTVKPVYIKDGSGIAYGQYSANLTITATQP